MDPIDEYDMSFITEKMTDENGNPLGDAKGTQNAQGILEEAYQCAANLIEKFDIVDETKTLL